MSRPCLLFVIDPWETLDHANDTTLRLVEEAITMGADCFLAESRSIGLDRGKVHGETKKVISISAPRTRDQIRTGPARWQELKSFDHIFYRTDPPVDLAYLLPLQLIASIERKKGRAGPRVHAPADTLFKLNEKWAPVALGALFPPSLVSASIVRLTAFLKREKRAVLKPLYLAQSRGVAVLSANRGKLAEAKKQLKIATDSGRIPVILQRYLPGIIRGETRLWFIEGRLLAAIRKIPKAGESVIDMDRGGSLARAKLSARDRAATKKVGAYLRRHAILFAAVDLIDGKVTDFNHTSPGLLVAMETLLHRNLAREALRPILG